MRYLKKSWCFVVFLALYGCAGQDAVDRAALLEQGFTAAETALLGYLRFPDCDIVPRPSPCSDDAVLAEIRPYDTAAWEAIQNYRTAAIEGRSDTVLAELLNAATAALGAFQNKVNVLPKAPSTSQLEEYRYATYPPDIGLGAAGTYLGAADREPRELDPEEGSVGSGGRTTDPRSGRGYPCRGATAVVCPA